MGRSVMDELADELLDERSRSRIGTTLRDKWHLDQLLGVGGMAAVYAATHRNGARGAVKILHLSVAHDTKIKERLLREGYLANKVGHAGAVRVLDDDIADDGSVFLVMELLEGSNVAESTARVGGILEPREVMLIADRVLDVLVAAHEKGIVHRDLKPENLFLTNDGALKVLDYGIAGVLERTENGSRATTRSGQLMGTPAFMSPEQARGRWEQVDMRSDLWAVGATMFTLLSGVQVHEEGTTTEVLAATFTVPARSLATVAPSVPAPLVAVVDRALQLQKDDRWASAREMQAAIRAAYESIVKEPITVARLGGSLVARTTSEPRSVRAHAVDALTVAHPTPRSRRRLMLAAGVTIAACLGVALARAPLTSRAPAGARSPEPTASSLTATAPADVSTGLPSARPDEAPGSGETPTTHEAPSAPPHATQGPMNPRRRPPPPPSASSGDATPANPPAPPAHPKNPLHI